MGKGKFRIGVVGFVGLILATLGQVSTAEAHRGRGFVSYGYVPYRYVAAPSYSVFAARPIVATYFGYYPGSNYYAPSYAYYGNYAGAIGYPSYGLGYYPRYSVYRPTVVRGPAWYGAPVTVMYRGRACRGFCF